MYTFITILIVTYITAVQALIKPAIKQKTKCCTYIGLYGSGLFNFGCYINLPTLFTYFLGFDIHTSSQPSFSCFATLFGFVMYYAKVEL